MNKRWLWAGAPVVLAIAAAGWAFGPRGTSGEAKPADPPLEFIQPELTATQLAALPQTVRFSGPLVAPGTVQVRAKAAGRLTALRVAEGDRVKPGQLLGTQDMADQTSRVAERAALVESARAALAQAERTQTQNERLAAQSFISGAALDTSRAAVQTAQAQLDAAQAAMNTTRVALRDGSITAPIGGIVAKRLALPGELLSPEQPLLTIVDLARLELAGSVATHEVARLAEGMAVQVLVEGHDSAVTGRIARIAPAADAGTRSLGVTVALDNPRETFRAGTYAMASVTLSDKQPRLVLPTSAVGSAAGQNHVWLIEDGKLVRRTVVLGRRDDAGGRVEVREGLSEGTQVLAARFDNLREGARALVVSQRSQSAAATQPR